MQIEPAKWKSVSKIQGPSRAGRHFSHNRTLIVAVLWGLPQFPEHPFRTYELALEECSGAGTDGLLPPCKQIAKNFVRCENPVFFAESQKPVGGNFSVQPSDALGRKS